MTQFQFDLICKILTEGTPILANELCGALQSLVQTCNATMNENEQLKAQLSELLKDEEAEEVTEN